MFVTAIENVKEFTRPIHTVIRSYGNNELEPGTSTLFFINELGCAITCKHVAELLILTSGVNNKYKAFIEEKKQIIGSKKYNKHLKNLENRHGYKDGVTLQIENLLPGCVDKIENIKYHLHPTEDLAILQFEGFSSLQYKNYAILLKDSSVIKQGKTLCRLGFPFPEFSNFKLENDNIVWTGEGRNNTPTFPIDGMITRMLLNGNKITGIEISTPGLKGQSGGPLFDKDGIVYGMQSSTRSLHLGFDVKDKEVIEKGKTKKVTNSPFLHLGNCVHVDIIKAFLTEKNIKFYEA